MKTNITLTVDIGQKAPCSIEHTLTYIFIHGGYSSVMFVFGVVSRNYTYPTRWGQERVFNWFEIIPISKVITLVTHFIRLFTGVLTLFGRGPPCHRIIGPPIDGV